MVLRAEPQARAQLQGAFSLATSSKTHYNVGFAKDVFKIKFLQLNTHSNTLLELGNFNQEQEIIEILIPINN